MKFWQIKFTFLLSLVISNYEGHAQTLIMNEVSNGPSGAQEYVEFVVVSNSVSYNCTSPTPPCIDIRGWIFDDNSGYHGTSGVAAGAVRFSQDPLWSCVPLGTIIVIYNDADPNPSLPANDLSMADGNCKIIAPISSTTLFEKNATTPGAAACSYPATGWIAGGSWTNTALANTSDCARIVNLAGCEVFSVCYGTTNNLNNLIYFSGAGTGNVYFFNGVDPQNQVNWTSGSATSMQTPGAPNNAANAAYINQFNNGCLPITPIVVTATSVNAGCSCNGTATASATGSIAGYTYVWYDAAFTPIGQTTATATGLCAGTYHVIGTSQIGCSDTATVTLTSTGTTSVTVNSATICNGSSASLTANPSTVGGTYSWSPGAQTTQSISVSPTSTTNYTVTYTLAGCNATASSTVTVNPIPTISVNSPTICNGQSATLTAAGGTTYLWNTGSTANSLSVSPTSTTSYTVTGTSAGCSNTAIAIVTVNPIPTITVNSPTICNGQSATLTAAGGTTYSWDTGSTANPLSVSPTTTTSYTVTATIAGCSNTAIATVTVNPIPTITVNSPNICNGQNATLTAAGGTTYSWDTGSTTNPLSVSPLSTTSYTVTGTSAGCSNTAIATVTVNPIPTITVNSPTICSGQSATLTAAGGTNYSWDTGSTSNPLSVSPTSTTSYTVTGTNAGCSNTAIATVTVNALPIITVNSVTICAGQSATLNAIGGTSYTWNTGATIDSIMVTPSSSTSYTVIGSDGTCINSATGTITVNSLPIITINSPTICVGQNASLNAQGATTYTWNNGSTQNPLIVSPTSTSTYTVTGTSLGCSDSVIATVTVNSIPNLIVNSDTICNGQTSTLNVSGGTSYLWNTGSTANSISVSPTATTTYTVIENSGVCTDTAFATVTVIANPTLILNAPNVCLGQSVTISANGATSYLWNTGASSSSITVSPISTTTYTVTGTTGACSSTSSLNVVVNNPPIVSVNNQSICPGQTATLSASGANNYIWNTGSTSSTINVLPTTNTSYTVIGTTNGCADTTTVSVTILPQPVVNFTADNKTGCAPLCVNFSDNSSVTTGTITSWAWNFSDGSNSSSQNPNHCFSNPGFYTISLTATASNGCVNNSIQNNYIEVYEQPIPAFNSNLTETDLFEPTIHFNNLSTNANTYSWDFDDGNFSSDINPQHLFTAEGFYNVQLTATSNQGCKDSVEHIIQIKPIFTFYAPNAFTPNGDDKNGIFIPMGTGWDPNKYEFSIFDRWGMECFKTNDVNIGWDGKANNGAAIAQIDTYVWKVNVVDVFGKPHFYNGVVSVIR